MRAHGNHKIWFTALLLLSFVAGCGDPDKNGVVGPTTPPTVILVTPPSATAGVCPNSAIISATFSKAMNPATITSSTFTLTAPGGANVAGAVTYNTTTNIATFKPASSLALNTAYTATITTGAADTFGNTLAANFVWTFTTAVAPCAGPAGPVALGTACSFGILAATPAVTSVGPTVVTGDIGIFPAASIVGFPPGTLTGTKHAGDAVAQTAQGDLTTAYNAAAGAAGGAVLPADIGGQTLPAGVYRTTSAQPSLGITGNLTLDGGGDPNAVWIFQVQSTLITAAGNSHIILINSANSHNVFWQVGSSATLGTNTIFQGTIMALASITGTTGATLNGRALARTGAITFDSNPVNVPPCP
jgi:Ice-binding-like/Bacterial Ig-like domain